MRRALKWIATFVGGAVALLHVFVSAGCGVYPASLGSGFVATGAGGAAAAGAHRASRIVLGPGETVEPGYGGYGYILFASRPDAAALPIYLALCDEFLVLEDDAALGDRGVPLGHRVLSVWRLRKSLDADEREKCDVLVRDYDYEAAAGMLSVMGLAGKTGPVLVAARQPYAPEIFQESYLRLDLSGRVGTDVRDGMKAWRQRMRIGPDHWDEGWRVERIRLNVAAGLTWLGALISVSKSE